MSGQKREPFDFIYLQWHGEDCDENCDENHSNDECSWCQDEIYSGDIKYVRADIYDTLATRVKELEAQINSTRLGFEFTVSVYESKLSNVTAQRDELFKYAAHLIDCPSNDGPLKCDCGLAELIAKIESESQK